MKKKDMDNLAATDLLERIKEWQEELLKLSIQRDTTKALKKIHLFKELKRNIARAFTVIRQKEMVV